MYFFSFSGVSSGSFAAGYTFERIGSKASFRLLSYVAFSLFIIQVSVNQLIRLRRTKAPITDTSTENVLEVSADAKCI